MASGKGAAQALLTALFGVLSSSTALKTLLGSWEEDPRIYQSFVAFDTAAAIRNTSWITFNVTGDVPSPAEQTTDIRDISVDIHVWVRDPDADKADAIAKMVAELLEGSGNDLSSDDLFVWMFLPTGYNKTFDANEEVWHTVLSYHGMMMAIT